MKQRKSALEHAAAVLASQRNQGLDSLALTLGDLEVAREDLNIAYFQIDKLMLKHLTVEQESLVMINMPPTFHAWRKKFGQARDLADATQPEAEQQD